MGYTKLFSSITASTIWNEPDHTRLVWITMLAMADRDGYVAASVPGLAVLARVPLPSVITALESFMSPDPWSRTKDHEGRRIEEVDGGWRLLNYDHYRSQMDAEMQREKAAARKQRSRQNAAERAARYREKALLSRNVTDVTQCHDIAEAKAVAKAEANNTPPTPLAGGEARTRTETDEALAFIRSEVDAVLELYRKGGKNAPQEHADMAARVLLGKPPATRHRLRKYVEWAFLNQWGTPRTTKSLYRLLQDGDWDVEITERQLPPPVEQRKQTDRQRGLAG
jgi:hypothetical protein